MAKLEMQRIQMVALHKDRKQILELLQRKGIVEMKSVELVDQSYRMDTSKQVAQFEKNANLAAQALEVLNENVPEQKSLFDSFNGRKEISVTEYKSMIHDDDIVVRKCNAILSNSKAIADDKTQIQRLNQLMEGLSPWLELDIPMKYKGTASTRAFIGYFPTQREREDIMAEIAEKAPALQDFELEVISSLRNQTCIVAICHKSIAEELETVLRTMNFTRPSDPTKHPPKIRMQRYQKEKEELEQDIEEKKKAIADMSDDREGIKFAVDYFDMRKEKYEALNRLAMTKRAFILDGYIPKKYAEGLTDLLTKQFDVGIETFPPSQEEDVPVLLQNNGFAEPVEPIVEMYALPTKNEIDPTAVMSFFYYILFGLMLSDAAYGILMILVSWFALKKFSLESNMKKTMKMFLFCGVSTTIWGAVFGSWFGDVVSVVSTTFFGGSAAIPPIWFSPLDDPMKMLMFSMAIGIIHIFFGLGCNFYTLWKAGKKKDAFYDVGFWYMLLGGLILFLLGSLLALPGFVSTIGVVAAVVGGVGIVLTGGRESKKIPIRLAKGLYSLYNVTGYLSDVLSYSRLLALGLATGVIASVINTMGAMVGKSVFGVIVFILVFLLGHTLNIAINLLGAYVHCNRLQFVEFFGKFYEGGGRAFSPLRPNTKYYKFKEEK